MGTITAISFSCLNPQTHAAGNQMAGVYINQSYIEKAAKDGPVKLMENNNPFSNLRVAFYAKDSVLVGEKGDEAKLTYHRQNDLITFWEEKWKITSDSTLQMKNEIFKKVPVRTQNAEFGTDPYFMHTDEVEYALNQAILEGDYELYQADKLIKNNIKLSADGKIAGWDLYTFYKLAYWGDDLQMTDPGSDVIRLFDPSRRGKTYIQDTGAKEYTVRPPYEEMFSIAWNTSHSEITLHRIGPSRAGEKGDHAIEEKVYTLRKIKMGINH